MSVLEKTVLIGSKFSEGGTVSHMWDFRLIAAQYEEKLWRLQQT